MSRAARRREIKRGLRRSGLSTIWCCRSLDTTTGTMVPVARGYRVMRHRDSRVAWRDSFRCKRLGMCWRILFCACGCLACLLFCRARVLGIVRINDVQTISAVLNEPEVTVSCGYRFCGRRRDFWVARCRTSIQFVLVAIAIQWRVVVT